MKVINLCSHNGKSFVISLLLVFLCCYQSMGQVIHNALLEGQKIPGIKVKGIIGDSALTLDFETLKGKLIILDFWNTACSACIANMPKMDSLQLKYKDKIQIVLVTKNKLQEVNKLFKRIGIKAPHIPNITNDTLLNRLFPHYGEPHHVWIDQAGIYQFPTFDHNATEKNIDGFLRGAKLNLSQKKDGVFNEDQTILSQLTKQFQPLICKYSIFMKGMNEYAVGGGSGKIKYDSVSKWPYFFSAINLSPLALIQVAFNKEVYGYEIGLLNLKNNKRLILETADNRLLYEPLNADEIDQWRLKNNWSWEIRIQPKSFDDLYQTMQSELNRTLPYKGVIEFRKIRYLALVRMKSIGTSEQGKLQGKEGVTFLTGKIQFKNANTIELARQLNYADISPLPVINETELKTGIDLSIATEDFYSLPNVKKKLNRMGLDLREREGNIKMLVIKNRTGP